MSKVHINDNLPGIIGLLETYPESGRRLRELAQFLMVEPGSLSRRERELIAVTVSMFNGCEFCAKSHAAVLVALDGKVGFEDIFFAFGAASSFLAGFVNSRPIEDLATMSFPISKRDISLMSIAFNVGNHSLVERPEDLTDQEVHDAALIASAFSMFNRYVTGLNPDVGSDEALLRAGKMIAERGYAR